MIKIDIRIAKKHIILDSINNKYTVIQGNSGQGKTLIRKLVGNRRLYKSEYNVNFSIVKNNEIVHNFDLDIIPRDLVVLPDLTDINLDTYRSELSKHSNLMYIIDENHPFLHLKGHEGVLKNSNNYFIIITRGDSALSRLPYSPSDILSLSDESDRLHNIYKPKYTKFVDDNSLNLYELKIEGFVIPED